MSDFVLLSADDVLAADDRRYDIVDVPEWGGKVRIRSLSAAEALEWADKNEKAPNTAGVRMVLISACDGDGKLIFTDRHIEALKGRSNKAMKRLVQRALDLNGFSDDEKAKMAAEQAKNDSGETADAVSPTA
jgi:hypothetical protein